ncbi:hypothetical protein [Cryobacterium psychrophilum]|uniref:hypothetical protein n=1 Tax=Cryobacterium psychrophilum TaxID=41988 RepID=UPI0010E0C75B|nr:hypothetical protein [Cryobacterium psychrophilum]TDW29421.1 hypothetical protein EDD25_1116 [Cryobacterium psychrophilum]
MSAAASAVKIAGAPISWGLREVPGWGHQLVLAEATGVRGYDAASSVPTELPSAG